MNCRLALPNLSHARAVEVISPALRHDTRSPMMGKSPALDTACSTSRRNLIVRKIISMMMALALSALPALSAQRKNIKQTDRLENAGTVLEEILSIPDNIPPDLLDKAECVVIFPSV